MKDSFLKSISRFLVVTFTMGVISPVGAQNLPRGGIDRRSEPARVMGDSFGAVGSPSLPGTALNAPSPPISELSYQVHVTGEVTGPGTYRVAASTRLSEVLHMAGDIQGAGSERTIEIKRQGGEKLTVDLTAFKLRGDLNANPYLLDNDMIVVPPRQRVVEIQGAVKKPGTYEITREKNVEDLFRLAQGMTAGADQANPLKVVRYVNGEKQIIDVANNLTARQNFQIQNADTVVVPHLLTKKHHFDYNLARLPGDNNLFYPSFEERVFVLGGVAQPGAYPFNPYYQVREYLTVAGGTTRLAKKRRLHLITTDGKKIRATETTRLNPGDTIMIPEMYLPPESFLQLILALTTSVLGVTTSILTLSR